MILEVTEETFEKEVLQSEQPVLLMFYREKGCGLCVKMKPVFEQYADAHPEVKCVKYKFNGTVDSVSGQFLFKVTPGFVNFINGKPIHTQDGMLSPEQLHLGFTPEKIPKQVSVKEAPLFTLLQAEAELIDKVGPMLKHLKELRAEIKMRRDFVRDFVDGKEPCCDGCAEGKPCEGCGGH